jgi:hydroxyethylthiazole kinase-like uncharacterized protein yjeF
VLILTADQIRAWDQYTIANGPISSVDLMERAAGKCVAWMMTHLAGNKQFHIFCGKGNNGGDGLAIGRLLFLKGYDVSIYIADYDTKPGNDFLVNLQRLQEIGFREIFFISQKDQFPSLPNEDYVIDSLFGSGLNRSPYGIVAELILHINISDANVIAIDLPSGLYADRSSKDNVIIEANVTLTFQCLKLALVMQENGPYIGQVIILDIGLHPGFLKTISPVHEYIEAGLVKNILKPRNPFAHKGNFGHALLIGGSYGKIGAVLLATKACMRTGAGLTTAFVPKCGYEIMQSTLPEAMLITDPEYDHVSSLPDEIEKYTSIGIGPGLGTKDATVKMLSFIIRRSAAPLVIDADGLNGLSQQPGLLKQLPPSTILSPHPKEFERLFGLSNNDFERVELASAMAKDLDIIIVLKSHHTLIALPGGMCYFNSTGNPGMAKGGSGDVLTGIITSLLAQGYQPEQAAILGVYIHGFAGDLALNVLSTESMLATDIITMISQAFRKLKETEH